MTRPMILVAAMAAALSLAACGSDTGPATTEGGTVQAAHTDPTAPANASADDGAMPMAGAGVSGAGAANTDSANANANANAGSGDGIASPDRYPAAQRTCVAEVARLSSTPENELVVTGTARTQAGVEVRVQRQELRSAWTCQTDAQGETLLGVQDGRAAG